MQDLRLILNMVLNFLFVRQVIVVLMHREGIVHDSALRKGL